MASITELLTRPEFWIAFDLAALALVLLAWRLRLAWWPAGLLRALLVGLVLLALLLSQLGRFDPRTLPLRQVLVVDQSDSLTAQTRQEALQMAARWQAGGNAAPTGADGANGAPGATSGEAPLGETRIGDEPPNRSIVVFGSEAVPLLAGVEQNAPGSIPGTGEVAAPAGTPVDGRASDIASAIDLAGDLLGDQPGQILLASDGLLDRPRAEAAGAAIARQAARGHTLDVIPLARARRKMTWPWAAWSRLKTCGPAPPSTCWCR